MGQLVEAKNDHRADVEKLSIFHPLSRRLHMMVLLMVGVFAVISMRINIGMAMTCMVNSTAVTLTELTSKNTSLLMEAAAIKSENKCIKNNEDGTPIVNDYGGSLNWGSDIQGMVFSSLFYGNVFSTIPAGYLADTQSPKALLTIAVVIYVVGTAATPLIAVHGGWLLLFFCRLFMGMGDGIVLPAANKFVTMWIPIEEKSTAVTIYTAGFPLASILGIPIYAYLCSSSLGWPAIFYFCAIVGAVWLLFWQVIAANSPHHCKQMHRRESMYLLPKPELQRRSKTHKLHVPLKKMFSSSAFFSLLICAFSIHVIVTFIHVYQPTFYKEVLFLSPVDNGIFAAVPPILEIVFRLIWGMTMDTLKQRKIMTPTTACKISQLFFGSTAAVIFLVLAFVADCEQPLITLMLFCVLSISLATTAGGFLTSVLSIAPAYTGIITSCTMMAGVVAKICFPLLVSFFNKTGTLAEWRPIFFIVAATTTTSITSPQETTAVLPLQQFLLKLSDWCRLNKLKLALEKCSVLRVGPNNPQTQYVIDGTLLKTVQEVRDLGVFFDSKLKFDHHTKNITSKARTALFILFKSLKSVNPAFLARMFCVYVRPILEFASPVFNQLPLKLVRNVESVQSLATKIIFHRAPMLRILPHKSYPERLRILKLTSLADRRALLDTNTFQKILTQKMNIQVPFTRITSNTRRKGWFNVPRFRTNIRQKSFFPRMAKMYKLTSSPAPH